MLGLMIIFTVFMVIAGAFDAYQTHYKETEEYREIEEHYFEDLRRIEKL